MDKVRSPIWYNAYVRGSPYSYISSTLFELGQWHLLDSQIFQSHNPLRQSILTLPFCAAGWRVVFEKGQTEMRVTCGSLSGVIKQLVDSEGRAACSQGAEVLQLITGIWLVPLSLSWDASVWLDSWKAECLLQEAVD